jgi:YD repeat-containing protein
MKQPIARFNFACVGDFKATRWSKTMKVPHTRKALLLRIFICALCAGSAVWAPTPTYAATNGSVAYTYDALGRVTTASYDTGVCILYSYDPNGNRLSETINVTAAGTTGVWGCFNWNLTGSGGAKWGS